MSPSPVLPPREFRDALGLFATGVCLVTLTDEQGVAHALTVNSFASVSLEPPLVLWSLQNDSEVFAMYASAQRFTIAVLAESQESLSGGYSRKGAHVMLEDHFIVGENGAPLVNDALVNLECHLENRLDGGDHTILLGRVTRIVRRDDQAASPEPLVFFAGGYRQLQ